MTDLLPLARSLAIKTRVAVLVDGDNFPYSEVNRLEASAAALGELVIRRVFGDVKKVGGWPESASYQMLHCSAGFGKKNLADMHLTVAAMDMAQRGMAHCFVIASDDRDFEPLVQFLLGGGFAVLRVRKTAEPAPAEAPPPVRPTPAKALSALDRRLRKMLKPAKLSMVQLGNAMKGATVAQQTGKATWRSYLQSRQDLYRLEGAKAATVVLWVGP